MTFQWGPATPADASPRGEEASSPRRLPLRRPETGRVLGGVCQGLAAHLDLPVQWLRLGFIAGALLGGATLVAYVFLWVMVPAGDPAELARALADPRRARTAPQPAAPPGVKSRWRHVSIANLAVGAILVLVAIFLVVRPLPSSIGQWLVPSFVVVAGALLSWSQLDSRQRDRLMGAEAASDRKGWVRVRFVGGIALVVIGVLAFVGRGTDPATAVSSAVAALAVLVGVALVLAPWWLRLIRDLAQERALRERADERADIAAHLHDSVLQTLAMLQRNSSDPAMVAKLARTQERELRQWLYADNAEVGTSLAAVVRDLADEIEDEFSVAVEVVVVGDTRPDEAAAALLQATREALKNAVRHGRPPFSVYCEVGPESLEISVQDRGDGFDIDEIPEDRFGVRESIIGRVKRRGGSVDIRQRGDGGTEIRMRMTRNGSEEVAG
ncbi:ATP-binding protein [Rarobacter faecitabidus]|uniref:Phage shock protein C (PspC) family protein n=1 Tax=Rarobacter faecitabidus TaxID=13243 RepID=A0A542ZXC6_RARFA|nr:ATP-binding protein [Rarobacter faecitabidus]TQL65013.1 phage shock protein C (PspC) family protein [Rarobacter faecitabidus]